LWENVLPRNVEKFLDPDDFQNSINSSLFKDRSLDEDPISSFHVKMMLTDRQTDGQTDRQTDGRTDRLTSAQ